MGDEAELAIEASLPGDDADFDEVRAAERTLFSRGYNRRQADYIEGLEMPHRVLDHVEYILDELR